MRMIIRYQSGLRVEAILLAADSDRMRVVIKTQRDAAELRRGDAGWLTEEGEAVEIEALIPISGTDVSQFCDALRPRANVAGGGFPVV